MIFAIAWVIGTLWAFRYTGHYFFVQESIDEPLIEGFMEIFTAIAAWPLILGTNGLRNLWVHVGCPEIKGYFKPAPKIESKGEKIARLEREAWDRARQIDRLERELEIG